VKEKCHRNDTPPLFMGHSELKMTHRYARLAPKVQRAVVELLKASYYF
jgi:hypothetical protein